MFPAWSQLVPPQTLRRLPLFDQELIPLGYYGTAYSAFTPAQARDPAHFEIVSNGIEEATRAEIKAADECEKARGEYEEAKKKLEECETRVKEAQTRLQWAKCRGGLYG